MVVPCSFSCCSQEFQFRLLWAYCFYHNPPFQNKAIQRSREIESDIESYGERKYNIYLPNCVKTSKNFSSVFGDFPISKMPHIIFFPQIFGGYLCTHQQLQKQKIKLHFMPCKAHKSQALPLHINNIECQTDPKQRIPCSCYFYCRGLLKDFSGKEHRHCQKETLLNQLN
jgi:hypothetical protein